MKKKPRLKKLQILEIRKIVPKVTKCADAWRNTEKFARYSHNSRNVPIRGET